MNKEEVINILTENLGMVDYIDITKYISDLEIENKQLKEEKQNVINYIIKELYEINKHQYAKGSRRLKKILELLGDNNE